MPPALCQAFFTAPTLRAFLFLVAGTVTNRIPSMRPISGVITAVAWSTVRSRT